MTATIVFLIAQQSAAEPGHSLYGMLWTFKLILFFMLAWRYFLPKRNPLSNGCRLLCRATGQTAGMIVYDAWRLFWRVSFNLVRRLLGWPAKPSRGRVRPRGPYRHGQRR